jgi:type IV pilus assembly protein PilM
MINLFESKNKEKIEKIVLSGGSALLPNFDKYLSKLLNINVVIGDPWSRISYPVDLKPLLKNIGPRFAVAVGLAMRGQE